MAGREPVDRGKTLPVEALLKTGIIAIIHEPSLINDWALALLKPVCTICTICPLGVPLRIENGRIGVRRLLIGMTYLNICLRCVHYLLVGGVIGHGEVVGRPLRNTCRLIHPSAGIARVTVFALFLQRCLSFPTYWICTSSTFFQTSLTWIASRASDSICSTHRAGSKNGRCVFADLVGQVRVQVT